MRTYELSGTSTIFNGNSTPEVTLNTVQDWGVLAGERVTGSLLKVGVNGFCYKYA